MIFSATLSATTIVLPTDEQLVAKAPVIVRGTVISSAAVEREGRLWTETRLAVDQTLKGGVTGTITIRELGGRVGETVSKIFGAPQYAVREQVLVFLTPTARGDYQTVDLFVGKFAAGKTLDGRQLWLRGTNDDHVNVLSGDFQPIEFRRIQRDAAGFERFVTDRVRGQASAAQYEVTMPVLETSAPSGRLQPSPDFTLLGEPAVSRWFAFDGGGSAQWVSFGSQNGYSGGGVNETRSGMATWNDYSGARIRYAYSGTTSSTPGGLNRSNGVNEIAFNDPLGEISGTYSNRSGGVVGMGGYMSSGSSAWNASFTADAAHPQGSYNARAIAEGNLTIQDGVSPSAGISSTLLAEIIAHEFGHTLGFGHSADGSALMYNTVTGLGPSLRADDQLGARWLYPSGSGGTPAPPPPPPPPPTVTVPVAPSNLGGAVSGNSVVLQWADNATNETGQSIYYAVGNGGFAKVGDVGAGMNTATVNGFSSGTFRLYVTAFNSAGESAPSNIVTVTIGATPPPPPPPPPQPALNAAFTWSPSNPIAGNPVSFTDQSTGGATAWLWNFGDGTSSSTQNPVKHYNAPGGYFVTLTVYRGSESRSASQNVPVAAQLPSAPPPPAVEVFRSLIPVAAQTSGLGGSQWRTELTIFNAGSEVVTVDLLFVPGSGSGLQNRSLTLAPKQSRTYANVLLDLYGISAGAGAVAIEAIGASATPQIKITSRTFNATGNGTYGQAVPAVSNSSLEQTLYVTGIQANADYRTNVGFVNRSAEAMTASLTLYNSDGGTLATGSVILQPMSFQQFALATYFPALTNRMVDAATMRVSVPARDAISSYASIIDNHTQDPVYMQGTAAPSGRSLMIPIVGRVQGINNTFWRSDVILFNPNGGWQPVTIQYGSQRKTLVLTGRETVVLADIVEQMGSQSGSGPLLLSWDGGTAPIVTTRTYTNVAAGTFGQSIDPVRAFASEQYVTGLRSDAAFRSNLGFANGGSAPITVQARLLSSFGTTIATNYVSVPANGQVQLSLAALFPGVNSAAVGNFTLHASADAATMFAYGSMIDNATGDPAFFEGR